MASQDRNIALVVLDSVRASTFYDLFDDDSCDLLPAIADSASVYPKAIANAPWTVPSHGSIFTGQYPSEHGITGDDPSWGRQTFVEDLGDVGYTTIGVSANPWLSPSYGFSDEFDHFLSTWEYFFDSSDMTNVLNQDAHLEKLRALAGEMKDGNPVKNLANLVFLLYRIRSGGDGTPHLVSRIRTLLETVDEPVFLFANLTDPHLPYEPPRDYAERHLPAGASFERATSINQDPWDYVSGKVDISTDEFELLEGLYRGSIDYVTDVLDPLLEDLGDETTVVLTGDHGENIGDFELMDHQYSVHQTLLEVPLLISGPEPPAERDGVVELRDLYPTILDIAGADGSSSGRGISLYSEDRREYAVSQYLSPRPDVETLRARSDRLRHDEETYTARRHVIQSADAKLVRFESGREELRDADDRTLDDQAAETTLSTELSDRIGAYTASESDDEVNSVVEDRLNELGYI